MEKDKENLKIKGNKPYPMLLIETRLSPIESMTMTRYIVYKKKINNMENKRLSKIASISSKKHLWLKRSWHKDVKSWLNHWGIKEAVTMQNNDNIKNVITSQFKEKLEIVVR
jgi:hypothetical protein